MASGVDLAEFSGDTDYNIMFGPDICGYSTKKVHAIFNYKGKNLLVKKEVKAEDDQLTHVYTLVVKSDNTYEILVDGESKQTGTLEEDWDFLEPRKIKDPELSKPDDWVDDAKMDDPEAEKPEDWDDEADGEWEPPMIDNPEYKGEWKARQIDNPDYKGAWVLPEIDNPEYNEEEAKTIGKFDEVCKLGFDLWQVKAGTIFDNLMITDDPEAAKKAGEELWAVTKDAEKKMKDEQDEEERKKAEAEAKTAEGDEDDEDLDDVEEDEEEKEDEGHDEL